MKFRHFIEGVDLRYWCELIFPPPLKSEIGFMWRNVMETGCVARGGQFFRYCSSWGAVENVMG